MGKKKQISIGCPQVTKIKISELTEAEYNPRIITDSALDGLTASLKKFGCVEPIVVNTRGAMKRIVGGHQRVKALARLGQKEAVCITVDLDKNEEKLLNITLNNPEIQGAFIKQLDDYIDELKGKLDTAEYLDLRIDCLRGGAGIKEKDGKCLDDEIPKPPKKAKTKKGDLWILGDHRLLCGDSTNDEDVSRLLNNEKPALFAIDPPYCIDYTGKDRPGDGKDWSGVYKEIDIEDPKQFMTKFLCIGLKYVQKKTAVYLWHADKRRYMVKEICDELGLLIHQVIIWVKPCAVLGYSFYMWRHEPCLLIWKKGDAPEYKSKDKSIGTIWPVGYIKSGDPTTPEYYTDVWELDWSGKKRNPGFEHPTVKPVEVFAIPMRVHTRVGDMCYEPFSGSGSQIIAAEKLERRCFAMEKEPIFCDVAVKRWEQWTGKKALLETRRRRGRRVLD